MDASGGSHQACHDLLVELAGRMPDELLWRLRDWLAAPSGTDTVGVLLPRELMRHRVGLTDHQRDLLAEVAGGWGPARRLLDAVLPVHVPAEPAFAFSADPAPADAALLSLLAVVRSHPGCDELAVARRDRRRVVLVRGGERPWALTALLQRILRAHGERAPAVEVLASESGTAGGASESGTAYHRAAQRVATVVWSRTELAVA